MSMSTIYTLLTIAIYTLLTIAACIMLLDVAMNNNEDEPKP